MIPVVIFSYGKETAAAKVAAARTIALGLGPVYIASDLADPVGPVPGVRVILTTFPRPRSLRGFDCFHGMLKVYQQVFAETGATHLLKLDSDTIVVRLDSILKAVSLNLPAFAGSQTDYPFLGWCCVLSKVFIDRLSHEAASTGCFNGHTQCCMPEDRVLGDRLAQWYGSHSSPFNPAGSFTAGYQYDRAKISLEEYANRFEVITFGNRKLIKGDRKVMVQTMERLVQILETR